MLWFAMCDGDAVHVDVAIRVFGLILAFSCRWERERCVDILLLTVTLIGIIPWEAARGTLTDKFGPNILLVVRHVAGCSIDPSALTACIAHSLSPGKSRLFPVGGSLGSSDG